MWAQSQPAWLCKLRHVLTRWDIQRTVSSVWGTLHCYWCAGLRCDKLQALCVLFTGVFCVKGLCLLYFHHVEEVFKSSWHLLLRVWWPDLKMSEAKLYPANKEILWVFYVLLTVHPCIISFKWSHLGAHYFFVYLFQLFYMFQATMCPSSEELDVSMWQWYFSLCMGGCSVA